MSRKHRRGRPGREYRLRVRATRRDPIDFEALARAALEQAAMDQRAGKQPAPPLKSPIRKRGDKRSEEVHYDNMV